MIADRYQNKEQSSYMDFDILHPYIVVFMDNIMAMEHWSYCKHIIIIILIIDYL